MNTTIRATSALLLALLAVAISCTDDPPTAPPDRGSPALVVAFPLDAAAHDRDGNGLVDLEVAFADPASGVDPATIRLVADRPLKDGPARGEDLLPHWTVVRADSTGLVVEETLEHLLPRGAVTLTVSVSDRAGNAAATSIALDLPVARRHTVLDLGAGTSILTSQVTLSPDGRRAYVTVEEGIGRSAIAVVDLERLAWVKTERIDVPGLSRTAVDAARDRLYVMSIDFPRMAVFDLGAERFVTAVPTAGRGIGIAYSARRDEIYVGLEVFAPGAPSTAWIGVLDAARLAHREIWDLGITSGSAPGGRMGMNALMLDPQESVLYSSTSPSGQQGILAVDPDRGELIAQFEIRPEDELMGGMIDLDLVGDELVATSGSGFGVGRIAVVPLARPEAVRFGEIGPFLVPKELAVSPDRREWAVTVGDRGAGRHEVLLMDAATLEVVWRESIPLTESSPADVEFRRDGHAFLVASSTKGDAASQRVPTELLVYLYR